jgi:thiol:disulfide interchange protein DsbD
MKSYKLFAIAFVSICCLLVCMQPLHAQTIDAAHKTLSHTFISGVKWGFISVLQPCLYAMFPVTVSFFLKRSESRAQGVRNAVLYSICIIAIFVLFAFIITLFFGKDKLYQISTSAAFNIFVFVLFMVFGISFLGAFEITLPSSWTNKADSRANMQSISGIFFMALTLVLVSFSCTAPFIGNLLIDITTQKERAGPIIGFLGYSIAIALPFAFFAMFPGLLNKIAKSGGWLNTLKVSFGFIEIAMALKFLSNADLVYHWRLLDRDIYLSLWIIIFGLLGFYLLGKIKFSHDDQLPLNEYGHPYISVPRLLFAIAALSFTIYMVPGLWGAPLNGISGWLPENKTQDFNLEKLIRNSRLNAIPGDSTKNIAVAIKPKRYTDILSSEIAGVQTFFDFNEAVAAAKAMNKPIMIDFTGHSCANCRKMEAEVLSKPEVSAVLHNDFVVASLYVDEKTALPDSEKYVSKFDQSLIDNVGAKNLDFEATIANYNAQPLYIFTDETGKIIQNAGGYDPNIQRFLGILQNAKAENKKRFPN